MMRAVLGRGAVVLAVTALLVLPALAHTGARPAVPVALEGTIEGRVVLRGGTPRRTMNRYPGAGGGGARGYEGVPAVAFLRGKLGVAGSPARSPQLLQTDTLFSPAILIVPVGTTVEFPNQDPFLHNVFSYSSPRRFDLGRYPQGESKSVRFDAPGIVKVYCEVHRWMRAAIIVVESPYHAVVADDGTFAIAAVPAGRYELVIWHMDLGEKTVEVVVPAQGTVRIDTTL